MKLCVSILALVKADLNTQCKDLELASKCVNDCTTKFLNCIGKKENPSVRKSTTRHDKSFTFMQDDRSVLQAVKFDIVAYKTFLDTCGSDSECIMGCSRDSLDCNERCPCYDACPNGCPCPHSSGYCPTQVCFYNLSSEKVEKLSLKRFLGRIMHNRK